MLRILLTKYNKISLYILLFDIFKEYYYPSLILYDREDKGNMKKKSMITLKFKNRCIIYRKHY